MLDCLHKKSCGYMKRLSRVCMKRLSLNFILFSSWQTALQKQGPGWCSLGTRLDLCMMLASLQSPLMHLAAAAVPSRANQPRMRLGSYMLILKQHTSALARCGRFPH